MTSHTANDIRAKSYDVFVSYKRLDADVRDILVEALQAAKLSVWWDTKLVSGAWRPQLADRINTCKLVVALWSNQAAEAPGEVHDEMSHARGLDRLMALRTDGAEIPKLFGEQNFMPFDGWADPAKRKAQLEAIVAEVRRRLAAPTYEVVETGKARTVSSLVAAPEFGDIPGAPDKLVGRDTELAMLHHAWASHPPTKVNAVVLHALGGAGKSALLRTFANELLAAGGGGAARIYGWSAYSQGSGEQKRADADGFISKALGDFGHEGNLPGDPVERARALARFIQKERVLLLLDGLEPLQDPPSLNKGRFKDKGLAELVRVLAARNPGVVVMTTRQEVPELGGYGPLVINHALDELSDSAGAELLVELGVRGRQRELEAAVREVQGHALSVTLLGTYLAEVCGGDIRHRDRFDFKNIVLTKAEQSELATDKTIVPAKRAAKVMRGYLDQFEKLATDPKRKAEGLGGPERALLHLLGLFDRPADGPAVDALLGKHIPGLTDDLFFEQISKSSWMGFKKWTEARELTSRESIARLREAKNRLRKLHLLSKANPKDPHELDAHPVVRAFFAGRLEETAPEAANAAHDILYRHYAAAAPDLPDTLEEMQPLFHAVQHGVKAGRVSDAYRLYVGRLNRDGAYLAQQFNAYGAELSVLANFFRKPWSDLLPEVPNQYVIANATCRCLWALGRFKDAANANEELYLPLAINGSQWNSAAVAADELMMTLLPLGEVPRARQIAVTSAKILPHCSDERAGGLSSAITEVAWTEGNDAEVSALVGRYKQLWKHEEMEGLSGAARHLFGLVDTNFAQDAMIVHFDSLSIEMARDQLDIIGNNPPFFAAKHANAVVLAFLARAHERIATDVANRLFEEAVPGLRELGFPDLLARALLARAAHRRRRAAAGETDLIEGIRADLAEVEDIAGEEMRLHLTDLALERARLALDVPTGFASPEAARGEAQAQTAKAADLIAATGYHRRDGELAELKARLAAA